MAPSLIAVDWGSSAFRAFLLDQDGQILARMSTDDGVFSVKNADFHEVLAANCGDWLREERDLPIIMSGAVGSRDGWLETPYCACPASGKKLASSCVRVENEAGLNLKIVTGVTGGNFFGGNDVMRGEEVQIFGAIKAKALNNALVCLPGTHSKWCVVKDGAIVSLTTFMTGEMFALMRRQSSVGALIEDTPFDQPSFLAGLAAAKGAGGLLHNLFSIRADILLGNLPRASAESYLSGMVIGHELDVVHNVLGDSLRILLVGSAGLNQRYAAALAEKGDNVATVPADEAFIRGIMILRAAQDSDF